MPLMRDLDNPHHPTALVIFKRVKAGQPTKKTTTQMDGRDLDGGA